MKSALKAFHQYGLRGAQRVRVVANRNHLLLVATNLYLDRLDLIGDDSVDGEFSGLPAGLWADFRYTESNSPSEQDVPRHAGHGSSVGLDDAGVISAVRNPDAVAGVNVLRRVQPEGSYRLVSDST